jgi:hypothetical protein
MEEHAIVVVEADHMRLPEWPLKRAPAGQAYEKRRRQRKQAEDDESDDKD